MSKWSKLWEQATKPAADAMSGRFRVHMYPLWMFFWFRNIKIIGILFPPPNSNQWHGTNLAYGYKQWGYFLVEERSDDLCLNYKHSRWTVEFIRDYVRQIGEGDYLGKFCIGTRFVMWFGLKKL